MGFFFLRRTQENLTYMRVASIMVGEIEHLIVSWDIMPPWRADPLGQV